MVKLDLEINEIIGLAEMKRIDEKQLKGFLETATKQELVDYTLLEFKRNNADDDEDIEEEDKETKDEGEDELDI